MLSFANNLCEVRIPRMRFKFSSTINMNFIVFIIRLHRLHEMWSTVTDVRSVCQTPVHLSVTSPSSAVRAVCARSEVIRCSLCQITLASYICLLTLE